MNPITVLQKGVDVMKYFKNNILTNNSTQIEFDKVIKKFQLKKSHKLIKINIFYFKSIDYFI